MLETATHERAEELLGEMLDLHGEGLARLLATLEPEARERLADDPVVSDMLLVHGLHPLPLERRVAAALDRVRPYLESHGGGVELLGIDEGIAHLRLKGSCHGCAASASTLELAVERALDEEAPDLLGLEVEGAVEAPRAPAKLLPIAAWRPLAEVPGPGELVAAGPGVVANVAGTLLAYRDACAGCGAPLRDGTLDEGTLACPACGRSWSLPLAGRLLGPEDLQLEPVPLLEEEGRVLVAG